MPEDKIKSSLYLSKELYQKIEKLAKSEKRSINQQILLLIEKALESGGDTEALQFVKMLLKGERPTNAQIIILAHALEIDTELLLDLVTHCLNKEARC